MGLTLSDFLQLNLGTILDLMYEYNNMITNANQQEEVQEATQEDTDRLFM